MKPTPEQDDCIAKFHTGRNLRINAYAGTGKTSTLTMLGKSTSKAGVYLAFNRSIATEARRKFSRNVACSTTHGMAFRAMRGRYEAPKLIGGVNGGFVAHKLGIKLPRAITDNGEIVVKPRTWGSLLCITLARWQRSDRAEITPRDVPINDIPSLAALELKAQAKLRETLVGESRILWERMLDPRSDLPLGHDGYLKLWALGKPTIDGDFIFLDEAQDTNGVVMGLMSHQPAQLICVGDRHQQIYAWRGAENAMTEMPTELEARLSTSFRFGPAIADHASAVLMQQLDEDLPLTGNLTMSSRVVSGTIDPDAILCRSNNTLINELITATQAKQNPYVIGGVSELLNYVRAAESLKAGKPVDHPLDFFGLKDWAEVQQIAETPEGAELKRWVEIIDSFGAEALHGLLESVPGSEDDAGLILSTGHKAKGREWPNVRLTDDFLKSGKKVGTEGVEETAPQAEEWRLYYVAATRGREMLEIPPLLKLKLEKHGVGLNTSSVPARIAPEPVQAISSAQVVITPRPAPEPPPAAQGTLFEDATDPFRTRTGSVKSPSPYLLVELRERRKTAISKSVHYRQYTSACAKADAAEADADVEFLTQVLECLDPQERRS